ncbi:hypothetical protein HYT58_02640 [Candidatus Woesearchaeota archaeon]|nr:hypothetical protein [Candidatus Woesearchaeota archaeon]
MKTIALQERTFEILEELKKEKKSQSFNELILKLVTENKKIPKSMFGSLKGKDKEFTTEERHKIWGEH